MKDLYDEVLQVLENMFLNIDTYFDSGYKFYDDGSATAFEVLPIFAYTNTAYHLENKEYSFNTDAAAAEWLNDHPGASLVGTSAYKKPRSSSYRTTYRETVRVYDGYNIVFTPLSSRSNADPAFTFPEDLDTITYDLRDFLTQYFYSYADINSTQMPFYFNSSFVSMLLSVYDAIKPIVGIGSTLDMLNCTILSRKDFFVLYYLYSYYYYYSNLSQGSISFPNVWDTSEMPTILSNSVINFLPIRANYCVWYWYYRDQLLETDAFEPSVEDTVTDTEIVCLLIPRYRCWSKDTFTTALTNTGTGSMVVRTDNIISTGTKNMTRLGNFSPETVLDAENAKVQGMDVVSYTLTDGTKVELPTRYLQGVQGTESVLSGHSEGFSLDMLNRAQRMQKWLQKALIYGNRPQDSLWTHWKVRSSDARLQLPEYISGESTLVRLDTITNNTTTAQSIAGDKAANAYGYFNGMKMNRFVEEHGFIISLFSVMPELSYGYGTDRKFVRMDKFDYAWPEFAQIGMDAVYVRELMDTGLDLSSLNLDELFMSVQNVFGYQGRYYDYKSKQDEIHGELLDEMDIYTFSRKFSPYGTSSRNNYPTLNYQFVHCHPRLDMFVSDSLSSPTFWFDIHHAQAVEHALPVPSMTV
ncbi:MAG: hypothetical protein NC038_06120 [Paludibacter sp.]|nr:hypothetical protein [Bacteroidales bacterium]MCM1069467.1 hypothetical protein [Prevotella sp.]MCM1354123.1 hypothetical protein [Bacteroides sp.]MCM1443020.1 hypothetical protein [Muribaculum sp.]MCM1482198.1 hypothetical protein [Paludibacter sp.]